MIDISLVALVAFALGSLLTYFYIRYRDTSEVLFFPDDKMPCNTFYQELDNEQIICRINNCQYAHAIDGSTSFMKIILALNRAERRIDLCVYDFTEPRLADFLIKKFNEGIQIRIITDAHLDRKQPQQQPTGDTGNNSPKTSTPTTNNSNNKNQSQQKGGWGGSKQQNRSGDQIPSLQAAGIPVKVNTATGNSFIPLMHNKFVIVDNNQLLMGSFNWTHSAIVRNHEALIKTNNPKIVGKFSEKFKDMWMILQDRPMK